MKDEKRNNKIGEIVIAIIIILIGGMIIYNLALAYVENQIQTKIEFENKYKPICEKYDKLWLESGGGYFARCFENNNGILTEYSIIQKGDEFYLKLK